MIKQIKISDCRKLNMGNLATYIGMKKIWSFQIKAIFPELNQTEEEHLNESTIEKDRSSAKLFKNLSYYVIICITLYRIIKIM